MKGREHNSAAATIRPLWMQVYLPNLIMATGQGAMLPILVFAAKGLGASPATAAVIVAINGFGMLAFDLPSGRIVARFGERGGGWIAAGLLAVGLLGCIAARTPWELGIAVFLQAAGWAVWTLVRMTHLSRVAPAEVRGRALSFLGGVQRCGNVIGPFFFIFIASHNHTTLAFVIYLIAVVVGFVWMVAARDRRDTAAEATHATVIRPWKVLRDNARQLPVSGTTAFGISLLRGSRTAIIPLWAAHIGLDAQSAASLFAFSSVIDLALFYPAGIASDKWGRRADALPCIALLALGHVLVPFTHAYVTLFLAAFVLGVGNGLGSGIVMTLGADLAPADGRASFLAVWRVISDAGTAVGPLVSSAVVGVASLAAAGPTVGVIGFATAGIVAVWLKEPEHLHGSAGSSAGVSAGSSAGVSAGASAGVSAGASVGSRGGSAVGSRGGSPVGSPVGSPGGSPVGGGSEPVGGGPPAGPASSVRVSPSPRGSSAGSVPPVD